MRLPEVTIAGFFLSGIALGLHPLVARHATSAAAILLIAGIISANLVNFVSRRLVPVFAD